MATAKVSTDELSEFKGLVSNQNASIQEGVGELCDALSQWLEQIAEEKERCANLQEKCQDAITDIEERIEELDGEIAAVEACLANTPPYIEVTHTDVDGETYTTLEPNPAYTALESELRGLELERDKYQQKLDQLQEILRKLEENLRKLNNAEQEINEIMQALQQVNATVEENVSRAEKLLDNVMQALEEYLSVTIGSSDGVGGSGAVEQAGFFGKAKDAIIARKAIRQAGGNQFKPLAATKYGFETMVVDGQVCQMYNKPYETAKSLIRDQGQNSRNMYGTCGLCQCVNQLRMAGLTNVTEDDVINVALGCSKNVRNCLEMNNPDPYERGGTTANGRKEILGKFNLDVANVPISPDKSSTVNVLGKAVSTGHGVIVSVDAGVLWNNPSYLGGGHAISLISVSQNGDTFIYSDTGTGKVGTISAATLGRALTGRPANITKHIIR